MLVNRCLLVLSAFAVLFGCVESPKPWSPAQGDASMDSLQLPDGTDGTGAVELSPSPDSLPDIHPDGPDADVPVADADVETVPDGSDDLVPACVENEECDDDNPCTEDVCKPGSGCTNTPVVADCDDGDPCTIGDLCIEGECAAGQEELACDDGNPCTDDTCEAQVGCSYEPNTEPCEDNNPCTVDDVCDSGSCLPGDNECDCDSDEECLELDDDNLCNGTFMCDQEAEPPACAIDPDSVVICDGPPPGPCQSWACQPESGECEAVASNEGDSCDDEDSCTTSDLCHSGECTGTPIPACGVGEPCASWEDCVNGLTCFTGMPGGYCTKLDCKNVECPGGTQCSPINDGDLDACLLPCDSDTDCRVEDGHGCTDGGGCWCGDEICQAGELFCVGETAGTCNTCGSALEPGAVDCSAGEQFCYQGECVDCVPDCTGKSCGDDGCGGSCGTCDVWSGLACIDDQCLCAAAPTADIDTLVKNGDEDYAYAVSLDSDGNYVIGGDSNEPGNVRAFHLVRISPIGNTICDQYLPGDGTHRVRALWPLAGGVMAIGGTHSPNKSDSFPTKWDFAFLLSKSGEFPCHMDKESIEYFGESNFEEPFDMKPLPNDAGYVFVGYRQTSADPEERDIWVVTTDPTGIANLPGIQHGGAGHQEARGIVVADDGYVVAGFSHATGQALAIKFSPLGNVVWATELGVGEAHDIVAVADGYALGGFQTNEGTGDDGIVWYVSDNGEVTGSGTWAGTGTDRGFGLAAMPSGGVVLVGTTTTAASGAQDGFVARFSGAGSLQWHTNVGGTMSDWALDVLVDGAGRIFLGGYGDRAGDYNYAKTDIWGLRLKAECE